MRKRLETTNETLRLAKRYSKAKALCSIVKVKLDFIIYLYVAVRRARKKNNVWPT